MALSTPTTQTTITELLLDRPARARLFQKLGIDFCCGGKLSLEDACRRKSLNPDTTLEALLVEDRAGVREPIESMTLAELCDHIETTHHAWLKQELPRLQAMLRKVAAVHGDRYPWTKDMAIVLEPFATELIAHMWKEEQILFPLIRAQERDGGLDSAKAPMLEGALSVMEQEHDDAGDALARLSELSNGFTPPRDACNTFIAVLDGLRGLTEDMQWHVHKENNVLFPRARGLREGGSALR